MEAPQFRAACVASPRSAEMQPVRDLMDRELAGWSLRHFSTLEPLIDAVPAEGYFPDLVIVCQNWRDQYAAGDVQAGLTALPLARWICVSGAWCESEGRHGSRWPPALRVPIRSLRTRLAGEIAVIQGRRSALPMTADREEIYEFDIRTQFPAALPKHADASVLSPDREFRSWLEDHLGPPGDRDPQTSPQFLLIDWDPPGEFAWSRLRNLRNEHPAAKILVIAERVDHTLEEQCRHAGADLVLSKLTPANQMLVGIGEI